LGQVVSQSELISHRGEWKRRGQVVVSVCGAFDLLHPGHIRLLEQARGLGDVLVVLIEAGRASPPTLVTPPNERAEILAALAAVDEVTAIDQSSRQGFLARMRPDIVARGAATCASDANRLEDAEIEALGCRVVYIPLEPGYTARNILQRIAELPA